MASVIELSSFVLGQVVGVNGRVVPHVFVDEDGQEVAALGF
jgi:hypothetical protein